MRRTSIIVGEDNVPIMSYTEGGMDLISSIRAEARAQNLANVQRAEGRCSSALVILQSTIRKSRASPVLQESRVLHVDENKSLV